MKTEVRSQKSEVRQHARASIALTVIASIVLAFAAACAGAKDVVKWSDKASRYSSRAASIVQGYVADGSIDREKGEKLVKRLNQLSADATLLADAFRNGATNTLELTANLIEALESILTHDVNLIPAGILRTTLMIALAVVEDALHDIVDDLAAKGDALRHHVLYGRLVQEAGKTRAAATLRKFAKKPRLRCRDAKTGKFLKIEQCKKSPETTVLERV